MKLQQNSKLTKNQGLVYDALSKADGPLSAYTILDGLRDHGIRAPLQVYRALDKLLEFGMVHRLESLNSFVVCRHPDCETQKTMVFAICESCENVLELADDGLVGQLATLADARGFSVKTTTIEMSGLCSDCSAVQP